MESKEIESILTDFISNKKSLERCIQIDGKWGVGKTYHTQKVVDAYTKKKNKKTKVFYTSLFGLDNIDDVRSNVSTLVDPKSKKAKKAMSVISAFTKGIKGLGIVENIANGMEILSRDADDRKLRKIIKKNVTIIFDDLERVGKNFSYISFHGLLNTLQLYGIKIVCICNSENILEGMELDFQEFKEKTFDRVYEINEPSIDYLAETFANFGIGDLEVQLLNQFLDSNLRIAEKTKNLTTEILNFFKEMRIDYSKKASGFMLALSCLFAIKIALEPKQDYEVDTISEKDDIYDSMFIDIEALKNISPSSDIYNNFETFFKANKYKLPTSPYEISGLTGAILCFYLFNDKKALIDYFDTYSKVDKNNLYDLPFMSKKDNETFSTKYLKSIENKGLVLNTQESFYQLQTFLKWTAIDINDEVIQTIAQNVADETSDLHLLKNNGARYQVEDELEPDPFDQIMKEAEKIFINNSSKNELNKMKLLVEQKDLFTLNNDLCKYFYNDQIPRESKKDLLEKIKDNQYFLPKDFSKALNKNQWSLCLNVARYILDFPEFKDDYKNELEKFKKKAKDKVSTRRIDDLLKQSGNFTNQILE